MQDLETGFILIDKPLKMTSHNVVNQLRKITKIRKIGHAGTLDPLASGLLILAIGRSATKNIQQYIKLDKTYIADIKLGAISTTYDQEGEIKKIKSDKIGLQQIKTIIKNFTGQIKQVPPMFSAKKIKGQKLYHLARQGKEIKRPAQKIEIFYINILKYNWPDLKIKVKCSSGTYIRSLAYDIGQQLGCGAYLAGLKRIKIGQYKLDNAIKISKINKKNWHKHIMPERSK